jgi:hypothetical protein
MQRSPIAVFAICLASLAVAQDTKQAVDPLVQARAKVRTALEKTAATPDTAFRASWALNTKNQNVQKDAGFVLAAANEGKIGGSWHAALVACKFDGDQADELLVAGRRTLARAKDHDWALRRGRFADGNGLDFVPDPELLLEQLASWDLAVVHRDVGALDDRPMEVVTVTLTDDQVAAALWSGLVPPALASGMNPFAMLLAARNGGARPPAAPPASTIDLAIHLDPATGLVHQLQFRSWTKQDPRLGQFAAVRAGGGVVQVVNGAQGQAEEEPAESEAPKEPAKMTYENGLPERPRTKKSVVDYTVRFSDHGKQAAPSLTDAQKKLLRL